MGRVAVENLRELAESRPEEVLEERREPRRGAPPALGLVTSDGQVGVDEGAEEPRPDAPLVVRGVPLRRPSLEAAPVIGVSRVERPQAVRGEELLLDRRKRPLGPAPCDEGPVEGEREELVGAEGEVSRPVRPDDVGEPADALVPEEGREALPRLVGDREEAGRREGVSEVGRVEADDAQRVVPERLHLDRLAGARRHDAPVDARVHPGELLARLARREEAVHVAADAEARAAQVPLDDLDEARVDLPAERVVARRLVVGADGLDEPEGAVDVVVLGLGPLVGEAVRDHAAVDVARERLEDRPGGVEPPGGEEETGERDHRVAPPVGEPRIAGDDRPPLAAPRDEPVGGAPEDAQGAAVGAGPLDLPPPLLLRVGEVGGVGGRAAGQRRDESRRGAVGEVPGERERREEVLGEREAARAVQVVLEAAVPEERLRGGGGVVGEPERREGADGREVHGALFPRECGVARRLDAAEGVVVAVREEGPDLQPDGSAAGEELPRHDRRRLALDEEEGSAQARPARLVFPRRERVDAEGAEQQVSARVELAAVVVDREVEAFLADDERLLELREEDGAAGRRRRRRDEEAVIAARAPPRDGRQRVAPETVGLEPLGVGEEREAVHRLERRGGTLHRVPPGAHLSGPTRSSGRSAREAPFAPSRRRRRGP